MYSCNQTKNRVSFSPRECSMFNKQVMYIGFVVSTLYLTLHGGGMADNRFLDPALFQKPFLIHDYYNHHLMVQPFVLTAGSAFGRETGIDRDHELFEIFGHYNQADIDKALQLSGRTSGSLFRSDLQGLVGGIPWEMKGHFDMYGLGFHYFYEACDYFGLGVILFALHANSRLEMTRNLREASALFSQPGDIQELFLVRQEMSEALDLCPGIWHKSGIGDIDVYLKAKWKREYYLRCRRIDVGARVGMLAPTAPRRNINNPASIPLGGDGHWGVYGMIDADFDIHEDIQAGCLLQFIKRIAKTQCYRMPAVCNSKCERPEDEVFEPINFGAIVGQAYVDPGITLNFTPYIAFKGVRDGLGFLLSYNITMHECDTVRAVGAAAELHPNTRAIQFLSKWRSEHATLGVFYDCGYYYEERFHKPIVSFTWDIPVDWLLSKRSFRTHGVSFILETQF